MTETHRPAGTRRRLLVTAPGAAAMVLATREQGKAKSSAAKARKRTRARMKAEALSRMGTDLADLTEAISQLHEYASVLQAFPGLQSVGDALMTMASNFEASRDNLGADLALARGESVPG